MNLNIKHHDVEATIDGGDIRLEQDIGAGESHVVLLSPEQFLMIADKLRGIVRPSPEAEESRKLRVISDRLRDFVLDDAFHDDLTRRCADGVTYYQELMGIDDLAWEYAYGLQPDSDKPVNSVGKAGGEAKATQADDFALVQGGAE